MTAFDISISRVPEDNFLAEFSKLSLESSMSTDAMKQQAMECLDSLALVPEAGRSLVMPVKFKSIDVHKVLLAMLEDALRRDIDSSVRYAAASIIQCHNDVRQFTQLAIAWLDLYMWPFKQAAMKAEYKVIYDDESESGEQTPTLADVAFKVMSQNVNIRDNFTCRITGQKSEESIPPPDPLVVPSEHAWVKNTPIIGRPALSLSRHGTLSTLDFLHVYCAIPVETLEPLEELICDPRNGFTVDLHSYRDFYNFFWCCVPTDDANTFKLVTVQPKYPPLRRGITGDLVTFKDLSHLHGNPSDPDDFPRHLPPPEGVPPPDRLFFEIHASVAHVLYHSGAGAVLQSMIETINYRDGRRGLDELRGFTLDSFSSARSVIETEGMKFYHEYAYESDSDSE